MLAAFEAGKKIGELEFASGGPGEVQIEVLDTDGETKRMNLSEAVAASEVCGRYWDTTLSTPRAAGVFGSISLLRQLPSVLGLGCYLVQDDHSRRKLDPVNHYLFEDGAPAALDGSMGQYMWGWRRYFWVSIWKEGKYLYEVAGLKPILGKPCYKIPVASKGAGNHGVMDRTNTILCSLISQAEQYRGGSGSVLSSGNMSEENASMLGYPATNIAIQNFEVYGAKRGVGWGAGWGWIETVTMLLMDIILGTWNAQEAFNPEKDANGLYQGGLGPGVSTMPNWGDYNGYYPVVPLTAGIELGDGIGVSIYPVKNSAGEVVYNAPVPVFFGLKNPFGHLWLGKNRIVAVKQADGSYKFYVAKSSLTTWNPADTEHMLEVGTLPAVAAAGWSYIKSINFNGLAGVPAELGATSSTYRSDGAYCDVATSGLRAPLGAGAASDGDSDGPAYFSGSDAPSNATAYLSSPLCEVDGDFDPVPTTITA